MEEEALANLPNRTVFRDSRRGYFGEPAIVTTFYIVGVTDLYDLERHVKSVEWGFGARIKSLKAEIARMDKLIAAWTLKDLREVTEEAASAQLASERAARKAERDAKNAAKDAKKAALEAKREARKAAQQAAIQKFLTDAQNVKGDKAATDELIKNLFNTKAKKAHGLISYYDWRPFEENLLELGLAVKDSYTDFVRLDYRFNH
jgi:septin family protein